MESPAILKIYGDIGEPDKMMEMFGITDDTTVSAKMVSDFLDANKEAKNIVVKINSRGGDVQEGWAIYDLLVNSGKTVKTVGEGKVYSIATIIFLAGSEREMMKNADGQIHNPYIPPYTLAGAYESGDLIKIAEGLQQEEEKILNFYVEKTGSPKDKLAGYMAADTKLSAEDMVTLGFATKVLEPIKAYAYIKPIKHFNMTPAEEKTFFDKVEAKITSVLQAVGLSRLPVKNMTLTDKDGNELILEKEEGEPAVGDACTPDGTFTMASGKVITIEGGVITAITDSAPAEKSELELANEKIAQLSAEVQSLKASNASALATEKAALKVKTEQVVALATDLQNLKNAWKPAARTTGGVTEKVDGVDLNRVQEILDMQNKKS